MKKAIFNTRSMVIILMTMVTMGLTKTSFANDTSSVAEKKSEFKFAGSMNDYPVFQLKLNNTEEDEFVVNIKDKHAEYLFTGVFRGKNISKKFRFDIENEDLQDVEIQITSKKTQQSQVYKINQSLRMVEDVWVAKL